MTTPPGNVRKMREALRKCVAFLEWLEVTEREFPGAPQNNTEAYLESLKALESPPRNCDVYGTKSAAFSAYLQEGSAMPFDEWLMAERIMYTNLGNWIQVEKEKHGKHRTH